MNDPFQAQVLKCFTNTMKLEQETNKPHNKSTTKKSPMYTYANIQKPIFSWSSHFHGFHTLSTLKTHTPKTLAQVYQTSTSKITPTSSQTP
jgi:hypothetical protein